MNEIQRLKSRRKKLSQRKERGHLRPVVATSDISSNAHLAELADGSVLANADASQYYSQRIHEFNSEISQYEITALVDSLDEGLDPLDHILEPAFLSLFDGAMRAFKIGTNQGITASRLYNECKSFSYEHTTNAAQPLDSYTENLVERGNIERYVGDTSYRNGSIVRDDVEHKMRDGSKMKAAKEAHFKGQRTAVDGYGGERAIYESKTHAKSSNEFQQKTEVDHAVSCKEICEQLKSNKALTDEDIKNIVNIDANLVATSMKNNRGKNVGKFDKSAFQLQREVDQGYVESASGIQTELTDDEIIVRRKMISEMDKAQIAIDKHTNQKVFNNLFLDEKSFKKRVEKEYIDSKSYRDEEVSVNEIKKHLDKKLEERKSIKTRISSDAGKAAANQSIGDIIIFAIKPIYYELKDCMINGIEMGVNASDFRSAIDKRVQRIKKFVVNQAGAMLKDGMFSFFKNFLSMLLEGIVNCFIGVFKNIIRMVKEGLKILTQIVPILRDNKKSMAEKGDAILKLVASSLTIFASLGIESWLSTLTIPEPFTIVISSILTALLTTLSMYLLDKLDLFGVKEDARLARIDEILNLNMSETEQEMFSMVNAIR